MKTVHVNASKEYDVLIGSGILDTLGQKVSALGKVRKVCVVSETNVYPLYGNAVLNSLQQEGLEVHSFVFPAGEASKNGATYLQLLSFLAAHQITRSDLIVALGGGVVGDLAGFAAATYLRGLRFVQVPTTLLAAVDSSVGGKTAIDLPEGKNLAGAFCQPSLVLCDIDCLNTLPEDIFRDGCAEVIKYGILYDEDFFNYLMDQGINFDREAVIARCVELKRDVVAVDEFDTGARMLLNLGHTIGHGVERQSNFEISHGKAVAIGMAIVSRAGASLGMTEMNSANRVISILKKFELPICCDYPPEDLAEAAFSDKKRSGNSVHLIIPKAIGQCDVVPTPINSITDFIKAGL